MLSQKLQDDLMSAYQQVHEGKRGHAAGDSDVEKQASQLASDVKYKAKGKVKEGASEEERKKVFMSILAASPAPNAVKAMARQKLLGEEVVQEMRFDDGKEGTKKRLKALEKKRGMKMPNHPQFKTEEKHLVCRKVQWLMTAQINQRVRQRIDFLQGQQRNVQRCR